MPLEAIQAELQTVISGAETKSASLREQRSALQLQLQTIRTELIRLEKQIAEVEGADVSLAKSALEALKPKSVGPRSRPSTRLERPVP